MDHSSHRGSLESQTGNPFQTDRWQREYIECYVYTRVNGTFKLIALGEHWMGIINVAVIGEAMRGIA